MKEGRREGEKEGKGEGGMKQVNKLSKTLAICYTLHTLHIRVSLSAERKRIPTSQNPETA